MEESEPDLISSNPVDVNLKYETYCSAVSGGDEKEWDFAWTRYQSSNVASEKSTLLSSLACTENVWLINRYLNMTLAQNSEVRKQDGYKVYNGVAINTVGRYLLWDFIRDRWNDITKHYSGFAVTYIGRTIKSISKSFNTKFELKQLMDFQTKHKNELKASTRDVQQAIEGVQNNVEWTERNFEIIWTWLKKTLKN